jgi:S1-C subfamily serine protease
MVASEEPGWHEPGNPLPGQAAPFATLTKPSPALPPSSFVLPLAPSPTSQSEPTRRRPARRAGLIGEASRYLALVLALVSLVLASVSAAVAHSAQQRAHALSSQLSSQASTLDRLRAEQAATSQAVGAVRRVLRIDMSSPSTTATAARVLASVVTVVAGNDLGSAFALQRTSDGGTLLVTNYHVVAGLWQTGAQEVTIKQGNLSFPGTINTVRPGADLASITVERALPLLRPAHKRAVPGEAVLVVGSPLGLSGTVTSGVVSALRNGKIQFSAPISPGNSGGPVVDSAGRVLGVAQEKIVGDYADALNFAIPVSQVCHALAACPT